jgi:hypothetical protein
MRDHRQRRDREGGTYYPLTVKKHLVLEVLVRAGQQVGMDETVAVVRAEEAA